MGVRNTGMGLITSVLVSFFVVIFLILLWQPLSEIVAGMNVGFLMFLNIKFYEFLAFFMGLVFAVTLVVRFAVKAKFGRKD